MLIQTSLMLAILAAIPVQGATLEEMAREIDGKVMAPCCWSQPVSQHYSQAADDIRRATRQMLAAGKSEQEILDYYVSVYGERILASPRARGFTLLVWILPWLFFIAGFVFLVFLLRSWTRKKPAMAAVSSAAVRLDENLRVRMEQEMKDFE
jgi:cytochrome c-type biogenesis protein CcmH